VIVFFEIEEWEENLAKEIFPSNKLVFFRDPLKLEHVALLEKCEVLVVFIYSKVSREVIEKMPNLKMVTTMSTGYDHIDLAACRERGITVCNVPTYGDHTVAQHTFCLLLALTRKLVPSVEQVRKGDFTPSVTLRGMDVHRKIIGVIGTGKIGSNVIRIAKGFDMQVVAYDPFPNPNLARDIGFTYVSLDELYARSDFISVHVPLLPTTKHLINADAIQKMKHGVILLNTSRGGIIETRALYDALMSGKVAAAGLDVLEEEAIIKEEKQLLSQQFKDVNYHTLVMNHLLVQHPNVLVTPHNAFNSKEALERIIRTTIGNIAAFYAQTPRNSIK
jgi:D-lactate dehydrogenase